MSSVEDARVNDAAELQNVLTRYVDSIDGYNQAAEVVESEDHAAAFLEIGQRRKKIAEQVARLIIDLGEKPEFSGSPEAAAHRWWMSLRVGMSDEEFRATLAECVRGEKELARTVHDALEKGDLRPAHAQVVSTMAGELLEALQIFETVLHQ